MIIVLYATINHPLLQTSSTFLLVSQENLKKSDWPLRDSYIRRQWMEWRLPTCLQTTVMVQ